MIYAPTFMIFNVLMRLVDEKRSGFRSQLRTVTSLSYLNELVDFVINLLQLWFIILICWLIGLAGSVWEEKNLEIFVLMVLFVLSLESYTFFISVFFRKGNNGPISIKLWFKITTKKILMKLFSKKPGRMQAKNLKMSVIFKFSTFILHRLFTNNFNNNLSIINLNVQWTIFLIICSKFCDDRQRIFLRITIHIILSSAERIRDILHRFSFEFFLQRNWYIGKRFAAFVVWCLSNFDYFNCHFLSAILYCNWL
jgi:hypothetical protein